MSDPSSGRRGVLAGGNFIVDTVKVIDSWPDQDTLCSISEIRRSNGGGPYNILKNLARLSPEIPCEACGLVGEDAEGSWLLEDCRRAGLDTAQLKTAKGVPTSSTDVMTVADTGRRTFFHARGANATLDVENFDFSQTRSKVFFLGYLMLLDTLDVLREDGRTGAAQVLKNAREAGLIAAVDCVSTPHPQFREIALASLGEADVFFVNEIEAGWILHREVTWESAIECIRDLAALGDHATVVLHFPEGAFALRPGDTEVVRQPAVDFPSELIEGALGAGDAFAAGFLYGVHGEWSVQDSLHCGVCVAAQSLTKSTPSDGIAALDECLKLGEIHGYRGHG